jgi:hypothetical protein
MPVSLMLRIEQISLISDSRSVVLQLTYTSTLTKSTMIRGDFLFSIVPMVSKYYCGKRSRNSRFRAAVQRALIREYHANGRVVFCYL